MELGRAIRGKRDAGRAVRKVWHIILALGLLLAPVLSGCGGSGKSEKATGPVVAVTAGVWVTTGDLVKPELYRIDPASNKVVATIELDGLCKGIAADGASLWLSDYGGGKVWRVDAATNKIVATVKVGGAPTAIAAGLGSIWVADANGGRVIRIDPVSNKVTATIKITNSLLNSICLLDNALWVASVDMIVSRVDAATNAVTGTIRVNTNPNGISAGFGSLWVGNPMGKSVLRLDPAAAKIAADIKTGNTHYTAAGGDFIAAANYAEGSVVFIDPQENKVSREVRAGNKPVSLVVGHGAVWTASTQDNKVYRIDSATGTVTDINLRKPGKIAVTQ